MDYDKAISTLEAIIASFAKFLRKNNSVTEADTRALFISRVLGEVLGWPETSVRRETKAHNGYVDYELSTSRPIMVVEAKRTGTTWKLGSRYPRSRYKLSGVIKTLKPAHDAILQAQRYAVDIGVLYCVVSNGPTWIVFRAQRTDKSWRDGEAVVFADLPCSQNRWHEFIDLLSFESASAGSLNKEFAVSQLARGNYQRILDRLPDRSGKRMRNRISMHLDPIMRRFYGELRSIEEVGACYVQSGDLEVIDERMRLVFRDTMPAFLRGHGAVDRVRRKQAETSFGDTVSELIASKTPDTTLLLCGGIGCGKTTFLRKFFVESIADESQDKTVRIELEFRAQPSDVSELEGFVDNQVKGKLLSSDTVDLNTEQALMKIFEDDLRADGKWSGANMRMKTEQRDHIRRYMRTSRRYNRAAARYCLSQKRVLIIVFDNVDQLEHAYQQSTFLLAQTLARSLPAIVIIALREESYFSAALQRTLGAYKNCTFHLPSPSLQGLLWKRWQFARKKLRDQDFVESELSPTPGSYPTKDVLAFLRVTHRALGTRYGNREITAFLDSLCFGNMRLSLEMFSTFVSSGYVDVSKILRVGPRYNVPLHEFAKTVILGDYRYYSSSRSPVWNVFERTGERNSSNFTALRILSYLASAASTNHIEGRGFVDIRALVGGMEDLFDNEEDVLKTLQSLLTRTIVELNTRETTTLVNATSIRATPAAIYYLTQLSARFVYLDLVLHDTPIGEDSVVGELSKSLRNAHADTMKRRFERADAFVGYLEREETRERDLFRLDQETGPFTVQFIPAIRKRFDKEKTAISQKLGLR